MGYGEYNETGAYLAASDDIECIVTANNETCSTIFATVEEEYGGELQQELKWTAADGDSIQRIKIWLQRIHLLCHLGDTWLLAIGL